MAREELQPLLVTAEEARQIRRKLAERFTVTGAATGRMTSGGPVLYVPRQSAGAGGAAGGAAEWFLARITGRQQLSSGVRMWRYAWEEVYLDHLGGVTLLEGGRTGSVTENYAINMIEMYNLTSGTGTQGNSVKENRAGFPATMLLQPVGGAIGENPVQVIVQLWPYTMKDAVGEAQGWLFWYENAHDGPCS